MQIDTLRPLSVRKVGGATTVPSGTISAVTSDNNDSTYVSFPLADSGNNWSVRMDPHTPPTDHQRHQIRGRIRCKTDLGTATENIDLGRGTTDAIQSTQVGVTVVMGAIEGNWTFAPGFSLAGTGTISDFNMGGGYPSFGAGGMTELQTSELYLDVDCRRKAVYASEVRDQAGVARNDGTVSDTTQPTFWFGPVVYDGLAPMRWSVTVTNASSNVWDGFGFGAPPESIQIPFGLNNDIYTVTFNASSVIRDNDEFLSFQAYSFTIDNATAAPSPPLLTVVRQDDAYLLSWEYPGGQTWDDDYVVTEIWRDDCAGSARIAAITDGLNGSYLDNNLPRLDGLVGPDSSGTCLVHAGDCDVTYRVRYWGYVSTTVTLPTTVPVAMIIAWPGTVASIPSGWLRVTDLDGFHPRGATGTGTPTATGGAATHTHSTPNHTHVLPSHSHPITGNSDNSNVSTTTRRFEGADRAISNQPHNHSFPSSTGFGDQSVSGATAAGTDPVTTDPLSRSVIWIRSDGSATQYPVGALAFSAQSVSGWTKDADSAGRYLKGAGTGGNAGLFFGNNTHTHPINPHTHTGGAHDHPNLTSGMSAAASTEGEQGGSGGDTPRWIGRHNHPINPLAGGVGTLASTAIDPTGVSNSEPPHRRLNILRNVNGGLQTRIIGLYTGSVGTLPAGLTLCNGSNGTPDMRGIFARDIGTDSVNTTGGAAAHTHYVPPHTHPATLHTHILRFSASEGGTYTRNTTGSTGNVATATHVHDDGLTVPAVVLPRSGGSGQSGSGSNIPVYREVHFVRLDGTIDGGSLPTPQQRTTEYASITVPALDFDDDLDRISTMGQPSLAVASTRSHGFPRMVIDSVPLDGGMHTVSTTEPGEDLSLVIAVTGADEIDALETVFRQGLVYWSPVGGVPGWFAPGAWTVTPATPEVKVLSVVMARQPWPEVPDPVTLL